MADEKAVCASSKKRIANVAGSVQFPCPGCGETIVRSKDARQIAAKYTCSKCGFEGPN